jgi:hypothetical protein
MEDCAGLLGKTMNSALYWLLHLIDTLLAFVFSITSFISALVAINVVVRRGCSRRGCGSVYRNRWSMRRTSLLLQLWCLEIRILLWESALLTS